MSTQQMDFSQIIDSTDIVDVIGEGVSLTKKGKDYIGLCPFHSDSNPSMSVSPEKRIFKCFSCNKAGNVVRYLMLKKGYNYLEAIQNLAQRQGIHLDFNRFNKEPKLSESQQESIQILSDFNAYFKASLLTNQKALDYCNFRRLSNQVREKFNIGFITNDAILKFGEELKYEKFKLHQAGLLNSDLYPIFRNRLSFGICNEYGQIVGFSARTLEKDEKPKYINSIESQIFNKSKILYNFHNAKDEIKTQKKVYLTEGFMDVIAIDSIGYHNVVALMGTALTQDQINLIKGNEAILFLDNDSAGLQATKKSILALLKNKIKTYVIHNTFSKDPDEILNKYGKDQLINLIENKKVGAIDYIYSWLVNFYNLSNNSSFEDFKEFNAEFAPFLENENQQIQEFYSNKFFNNYGFHLQIKSVVPGETYGYYSDSNDYDYSYSEDVDNQYNKIINEQIIPNSPSHYSSHTTKKVVIKGTDLLWGRDCSILILMNLFHNKDFFKYFVSERNAEFDFYVILNSLRYFKTYQFFFELKKIVEKNQNLDLVHSFEEFKKFEPQFLKWILNEIYVYANDTTVSIDELKKLVWSETEWSSTKYYTILRTANDFLNQFSSELENSATTWIAENLNKYNDQEQLSNDFVFSTEYDSDLWLFDYNFLKLMILHKTHLIKDENDLKDKQKTYIKNLLLKTKLKKERNE